MFRRINCLLVGVEVAGEAEFFVNCVDAYSAPLGVVLTASLFYVSKTKTHSKRLTRCK
jgi:hypothetical protein